MFILHNQLVHDYSVTKTPLNRV